MTEIPQYLGREYSIYGKVAKGEQLGKKLGFSTANIFPEVTLALAAGVYVTKIKLAKKIYFGVTNAGNKPTFGKNTFTVETLFLILRMTFTVSILEIIPLHQLRTEIKFLGIEDLKKQIIKDVKSAQKYLISNNLLSKILNTEMKETSISEACLGGTRKRLNGMKMAAIPNAKKARPRVAVSPSWSKISIIKPAIGEPSVPPIPHIIENAPHPATSDAPEKRSPSSTSATV